VSPLLLARVCVSAALLARLHCEAGGWGRLGLREQEESVPGFKCRFFFPKKIFRELLDSFMCHCRTASPEKKAPFPCPLLIIKKLKTVSVRVVKKLGGAQEGRSHLPAAQKIGVRDSQKVTMQKMKAAMRATISTWLTLPRPLQLAQTMRSSSLRPAFPASLEPDRTKPEPSHTGHRSLHREKRRKADPTKAMAMAPDEVNGPLGRNVARGGKDSKLCGTPHTRLGGQAGQGSSRMRLRGSGATDGGLGGQPREAREPTGPEPAGKSRRPSRRSTRQPLLMAVS